MVLGTLRTLDGICGAFWLSLALALFPPSPASAAEARDEASTLTVATRHVPPFAIKEADGTWSGISIDLWRGIADELGFNFLFREMGLAEMLSAVERSEVQLAVAALTITGARETSMDFTHPFLSSGLGIAVPRSGDGWLAVTQRFYSPAFLKVTAALLGLLSLVGFAVWVFERRRNDQFGGTAAEGIGSGLWWSAVTMTTVGYGDKAPMTFGGRAVAMVWMFASVIIVSSFTAAIATTLTVGQLAGKVRSKEDLARVRIATVASSTSAQYLASKRYDIVTFSELDQALPNLASGKVDAVVYDAAILRYRIRNDFNDQLTVLPGSFARQDYGFALPPGSVHREAINRVLLRRLQDPAWETLTYRYLGSRE